MARLINPNAVLNASTVTLGDLLRASTHEIPDYQRDFSWGADELNKLWDDVVRTWKRAFPRGQQVRDPEGHFLGAVVTHRPTGNRLNPEIIDGQQRLTTISILIGVLYEFAADISDEDVKTNVKAQLLNLIADAHSNGRDPRLKLAREHAFYNQSIVQNLTMEARETYWQTAALEKHPVRQRIRQAIILLHERVSSMLVENPLNRDVIVSQLVDVVTELMMVLQLEVVDHRMAYKVFETLNFRGLDLSQADLIKNELVRRGESQGTRASVVADWEELNKNLDKTKYVSLVEFLQYHFVSKYGPVRASELFESVVQHLTENAIMATQYTEDLVAESARLIQLIEGDAVWSAETNDALEEIREILGVKFAYPLLMAAFARHLHDVEGLQRWACWTRDFCFRYNTIGRKPLGSFETVVTEAARLLRNSSIGEDAVLGSLQAASPDAVFEEQFAKASVTTNKVGFYVIKCIEDYISRGAGKTFPQGPTQHLEHIMPKKPGNEWGHVSEDPNYDSYLPRIGNLLGLEQAINTHIRNKAFTYKTGNARNLDYGHSVFALPAQAVDYVNSDGDWDFSSIDRRQRQLATEYAAVVWPLK
jgi:hypothetical protein